MSISRKLMMGASGSLGEKLYIESLFSTWLYTGNGSTQTIINNISLGDSVRTLVGKTITNLGSAFNSSYPLSNINDNILETSNGANIAYNQGTFDIYVDLVNPTVVTAYLLAPQGTKDSAVYNTPTEFIVYASNDASSWTTITTVSSISTGYPNWNAGSFRTFSFSNSTAYRYWRLAITSSSDPGNISVSEWQVTGTQSGVGKGGMVWIKNRTGTQDHVLTDTARGVTKVLKTNLTNAEAVNSGGLTAFNSDGFTVGNNFDYNGSTANLTSWTFRKAPGFFDVVTYVGNGSGASIAHNLGSVPGCILLKRTDTTSDWLVYHRGLYSDPAQAYNYFLKLNTTDASSSASQPWNAAPTSTVFNVSNNQNACVDGATYVAYLFAHDEQIFGESADQSVIKCGSYTGTGSATGPVIDLGWEPQWVMIKPSGAGTTEGWHMLDTIRGFDLTNASRLIANSNAAEGVWGGSYVRPTANGFQPLVTSSEVNASGMTYIYIAIRRGPMKTPTSGTEVFSLATSAASSNPSFSSSHVVDFAFNGNVLSANWYWQSRLTGSRYLKSHLTNAEASEVNITWDHMRGVWKDLGPDSNQRAWMFRRAPGFFDVVAYTGTGVATQTIPHNLGVTPQLIIVKCRSNASTDWLVKPNQSTADYLYLNFSNAQAGPSTTIWSSTNQDATNFYVGPSAATGAVSRTFVAYLFATCPGVSKVGSYTGTGTTLNIDCGFTSGARFVLVKRTDSTGDWYVWDTARGIVAGNDPYLLLNSPAAEVTNTDYIDPLSSGFQISSTAPAEINASGGSYIFLAIA